MGVSVSRACTHLDLILLYLSGSSKNEPLELELIVIETFIFYLIKSLCEAVR